MAILSKPEFWYTLATIITAFVIFYMSLGLKSGKKYLLRLFKANQDFSFHHLWNRRIVYLSWACFI